LAAPAARADGPAPTAPTRIGLLVGRDDPLAESLIRGAELALEQACGERAFELRVGRVESPWHSTAGVARDLVHAEGCVALLASPDREVSHLASLIVSRSHVPLVTLSSDSTLTRAGSPWVFRLVPDDRAQIGALVGALATQPTRVAALVPEGRAGSSVRADLAFLSGRTGVVFGPVVDVGAAPTAATLEPLLERRDQPLLIWLPETQSQPLLEVAASLGWRGPVLLPGALGQPPSAAACAGLHVIAGFPLGGGPNPCDTRFRESFLAAFGRAPAVAAACAFDAAALLARALDAAAGDPEDARQWLATDRIHAGVTGTFQLDGAGNRDRPWPIECWHSSTTRLRSALRVGCTMPDPLASLPSSRSFR